MDRNRRYIEWFNRLSLERRANIIEYELPDPDDDCIQVEIIAAISPKMPEPFCIDSEDNKPWI